MTIRAERSNFFFLTLLFLAAISGCDLLGYRSPEEHMARAKAFQAKGDLQSAKIELQQALQDAPNNTEARYQMGLLHLRVGDGAGAEKELRRATEFGKQSADVAIALIRSLLVQKKFDEIRKAEIQEVIDGHEASETRTNADLATLTALRGHAKFGLNEIEAAEKSYATALSLSPEEPEALLGKARLAVAQRNVAEARDWIRRAIDEKSDFIAAWQLFGLIEVAENNPAAAEAAYTNAIKHGSYDAADWLYRALTRIALNNYEQAQQDIAHVEARVKKSPGAAYARGLIAYQMGKHDEAHDRFQEAVSFGPDYAPAVFYLGLTSVQLGKYEQAAARLTEYVARDPQNGTAVKLLAAVRAQLGDMDGSRDLMNTVLARNPADTQALDFLGKIAMHGGNVEEGVEYFKRVVAQEVDSPSAHLHFGLAMLSAGKKKEGIAELQRAIELVPDASKMQYLLFDRFFKSKDYDEALGVAQQLHAENPSEPMPIYLRGVVYMTVGDEALARQSFDECLKLKPGFAPSIRDLAHLDIRAGDLASAQRLFDEGLKHNPTDLSLLLESASLFAKRNDVEHAKQILETALQSHPGELEPRILLARYHTESGAPSRALALLSAVETNFSENPALHVEKGLALLANGDSALALASFETLVKLTPNNAYSHELLARAMLSSNDAAGAESALGKALELDPNQLSANLTYIDLLTARGDLEGADHRLSEFFSRRPADPDVIAPFKMAEARLALRMRNAPRAVTAARQAFDAAPSSASVTMLGQSYLANNDSAAALLAIEDWLTDHPRDEGSMQVLAKLYEMLNEPDKALGTYERLLAVAPTNLFALNNAAWLIRTKDIKKAKEYADKSVSIAPKRAEVLDTAGMIYLQLGDAKRAVELLDLSVQLLPNSTIRFHLAQALHANGEQERARRVLSAALSSSSKFPERGDAEEFGKTLGLTISSPTNSASDASP